MTREQLVAIIARERPTEYQTALDILWFLQRHERRPDVHPNEIADFFSEHDLGYPNRSRLASRLRSDREILNNRQTGTIRFRATAIQDFDERFGLQTVDLITTPLIDNLEQNLEKIKNGQTHAFLREAIECARNGTQRAAIIMSWCGAVSVMQEFAFQNHLTAFNDDALKNGLLKAPAKTIADMRNISKESQLLECLARISILDGATKRSLKRCLDRRNDVGHPSEIKISNAAVADQLETLMLNVFERFAGN